jgi:hypothetical protein
MERTAGDIGKALEGKPIRRGGNVFRSYGRYGSAFVASKGLALRLGKLADGHYTDPWLVIAMYSST